MSADLLADWFPDGIPNCPGCGQTLSGWITSDCWHVDCHPNPEGAQP